MSQEDLSPVQPETEVLPVDLQALSEQREKVFGNLIDKLKPWLLEFGNWIFGGLIAFNLVIVAPLLTVGPSHPEIVMSITAFVLALPLNVSGLFVLKLITDLKNVAIDDVMREAFQDAGVAEVDLPATQERDLMYKKRTDVGLRYSMRLTFLSALLTLLGIVAALWYIAWWVAVSFLIVVAITLAITVGVVARLMRPDYEVQKELNRHQWEQNTRRQNRRGRNNP